MKDWIIEFITSIKIFFTEIEILETILNVEHLPHENIVF